MALQPSQSDFSIVRRIRRRSQQLRKLTDEQLREKSLRLRYEVLEGLPLTQLMIAGFALVVEASRRQTGMVHYDVQLVGGIKLARQRIAEMKTGEGKTLTATLPTYLFALAGRGAHVATVNDYLASRDAKLMGPVYRALGLSVGTVCRGDTPAERHAAYRKDVTYGTAKEFGFDFLRDRISLRARGISTVATQQAVEDQRLLHRPFHFALIDEADSILIDEARTPLVIAMANEAEQQIERACLLWAAKFAPMFVENEDFQYDRERRKIDLTASGLTKLRGLPQNEGTKRVGVHQLYRYVENAIKVNRDFHRDQTYTINDDDIQIIDEFTGRIADGRQWQDGIHQAIQAKEGVQITPENQQTASITIQTLARLYPNFAGMTGTAWTSRREFRKVYRKSVVRVPTNEPVRRKQLPVRVFRNMNEKWNAIANETKSMVESNRAVLIGTRTIERSEQFSIALRNAGIAHHVLNARHHDREAQIVEDAGKAGRVTVATNMAGRGTDIKLDPLVAESGGLHVILTEIHEAERIDRQMIGRGCRQGDPGSYRLFVSMDDEILKLGFGPDRYHRIKLRFEKVEHIPARTFRLFRVAQLRLQRKYLVDRMVLLRMDKDRHQQYFEMGLDPFLYATTSSR